jgi:hypothetical protein
MAFVAPKGLVIRHGQLKLELKAKKAKRLIYSAFGNRIEIA